MSFSFFGADMNSAPDLPLISVVIPNYNGADYLERCLRSLAAQTYRNFEIVLVDNASQDESVRIAQSVAPGAIIILQQRNTGFAGGANAGIKASGGEWVAILNNDTELSPEWLSECAAAIRRRPEAAFFACRILEFAGRDRLFSAGDCFLRAGIGYRRGQQQGDRKEFHVECEVFSASGCAALYRKTVLEELAGFDERFFAYLEDVDLGLRLQSAGYTGFYIPRAEVYHHGGATSGGEFSRLSVRLRTGMHSSFCSECSGCSGPAVPPDDHSCTGGMASAHGNTGGSEAISGDLQAHTLLLRQWFGPVSNHAPTGGFHVGTSGRKFWLPSCRQREIFRERRQTRFS